MSRLAQSVPPMDSRFQGGDEAGIGADGIAGRRGPVDHPPPRAIRESPLQLHWRFLGGWTVLLAPAAGGDSGWGQVPALHFSLMTRDET